MTVDRRLRSGYFDLGPFKLPIRPQAVILTDRDDGTKWLISFNTSAPERLSINTEYATLYNKEDIRTYSANDGPRMDEDGEYRLMVRGGRLGFDYTPFSQAISASSDNPSYARLGNDMRLLIMDGILVHIGTRS